MPILFFKETLCFSDFPHPAESTSYLYNAKLLEYLKMYAKHFNLEKYIRFGTIVVEVIQADDFSATGQWIVRVKDSVSGMFSLSSTMIKCSLDLCNRPVSRLKSDAAFWTNQILV